MWTQARFSLHGKYYDITDVPLEPKPKSKPHPTIFQGGNSAAAREMAARVSDVLFINGGSVEHIAALIADVRRRAARYGRENNIRFAMNAFVIARDTQAEAEQTLREIIKQANVEAVQGFGEAVKEAGQASPEGEGMWSNSNFEDLVQYNDGFKPQLIGTPEFIAQRIQQYEAVGIEFSSPAIFTSSKRSTTSAGPFVRSCGNCRACGVDVWRKSRSERRARSRWQGEAGAAPRHGVPTDDPLREDRFA